MRATDHGRPGQTGQNQDVLANKLEQLVKEQKRTNALLVAILSPVEMISRSCSKLVDAAFAIQKLLAEMLHAMSSIAQHIAILSQFFSHLHQALLAQSLEAMHTAVHMQGILCMHAGAIIGSMLFGLPFQQAACRRSACRRGVWGHGSALIKQALQSFGSLPTAWMSTKIPGQCSGWLAMMGVPCHWAVIGSWWLGALLLLLGTWAMQSGALTTAHSQPLLPQKLNQLLLSYGFGLGHASMQQPKQQDYLHATFKSRRGAGCGSQAGLFRWPWAAQCLYDWLSAAMSTRIWPLVQAGLWQQLRLLPLHAASAWLMGGRMWIWGLLHAVWCMSLPIALHMQQQSSNSTSTTASNQQQTNPTILRYPGDAHLTQQPAVQAWSSPSAGSSATGSGLMTQVRYPPIFPTTGDGSSLGPKQAMQSSHHHVDHHVPVVPQRAFSPLMVWGTLLPGCVGAVPFLLHPVWLGMCWRLALCSAACLALAAWHVHAPRETQ